MAELITFAVYVLATARMVRLISKDKLTTRIRGWWLKRWPETRLLGYLITCVWCLSVWLAVVPGVSWVVAPDHVVLKSVAAVFAVSWLASVAQLGTVLLEAKIKMFSAVPEPEVTNEEPDQAP